MLARANIVQLDWYLVLRQDARAQDQPHGVGGHAGVGIVAQPDPARAARQEAEQAVAAETLPLAAAGALVAALGVGAVGVADGVERVRRQPLAVGPAHPDLVASVLADQRRPTEDS